MHSNRTGITGYGFNQTTPEPLNESTKKLFQAIDGENLENFKQAIAEGADVNAFDDGYTPLMTIVTNLSAGSGAEKEYQNMIRLLLLHRGIDVNIYEQNNNNTVLHLAMCFQQKEVLQLLLNHPNIDTSLINRSGQSISMCAMQNRAGHLKGEIQKAQKGKELLNALSNGNVYLAKMLLNRELNPNCWKRTQDGEIEIPLGLIIKSCSEGITQDKQEVLIKLLKHKDLDFSQIKPMRAMEQNPQLKQIIERAITERLTDAISRKDLDDVKELVENSCFMNRAIITDVLEYIERARNYLNRKFPANTVQPSVSMNNVPADFEGFVQELVDELERTKAQLTEKEQELNRVVHEGAIETSRISQLERDLERAERERVDQRVQITRLTNENAQLRTQNQSLNSENQRSSEASAQDRKQSNYAFAFFTLFGICAVGACLVIEDYPVVSAYLAAVALTLFLVGYFLYNGNKKDIGPSSTTDNPCITRVLIPSPSFAESSYTY